MDKEDYREMVYEHIQGTGEDRLLSIMLEKQMREVDLLQCGKNLVEHVVRERIKRICNVTRYSRRIILPLPFQRETKLQK